MTREEAINTVRNIYQTDKEKEALGILIPELAESEDERIMSRIIDGFKNFSRSASKWNNIPVEEVIAYLEKQKEQKPAESISQLTVQGKGVYKICPRCKERMVRDDSMVYTSMPPQYRYECPKCGESECDTVMYDNPEMEEQKPLKVGENAYFDPNTQMWFIKEEQKSADLSEMMVHKEPYIAPVPTPMVADEQKPAEWSEEDEIMLKWIEDILLIADDDLNDKLNGKVSPITDSAYSSMKKCIAKCRSWLKSIRPQPQKELSIEKAIKWLDDTFYFLDNSSGRGRDCEITTHDFDSLEEMYDSFRKAVIVDSEPHWKPSEEDLMMLEHIIGQYEIGNKNSKTMGYLPRVEELNFLKKILDVWKN